MLTESKLTCRSYRPKVHSSLLTFHGSIGRTSSTQSSQLKAHSSKLTAQSTKLIARISHLKAHSSKLTAHSSYLEAHSSTLNKVSSSSFIASSLKVESSATNSRAQNPRINQKALFQQLRVPLVAFPPRFRHHLRLPLLSHIVRPRPAQQRSRFTTNGQNC